MGIRVPEDVSVTGLDDARLAGLAQIDLTRLNPSQPDQARLAVEAAVAPPEGTRSNASSTSSGAWKRVAGRCFTCRRSRTNRHEPHVNHVGVRNAYGSNRRLIDL